MFASGGFAGGAVSIPSQLSKIGTMSIDASIKDCTFSSDIDFKAALEEQRTKIMKEISFLMNGGGN